MEEAGFVSDNASITSVQSVNPSVDTLTRLTKRIRAMTLTLLPVEVEIASIVEPTSRIITPQVISAYKAAAGDFLEALPYSLLRARQQFMRDANRNAADFDENQGRAIACEVLARRIAHQAPPDRLTAIMSTRYRHRASDGDIELSSALELAIDSHCTIFLSSSESQDVVNHIWNGNLVQKHNANDDIDFVPYDEHRDHTFWGHLNPDRIAVPRYQNFLRIVIWFIFLAVYSQAVREPLDKLDPNFYSTIDGWELALYILSLSFAFEDGHKMYKLLKFASIQAFSFWNIVSFMTEALLTTAFVLRVVGLASSGHNSDTLRLRSFQVLSYVSPFIWMKLVTVFDGYKYIGTMQICIARMLRESGIFFALLSVMGIGFLQGLYALDAADGQTDSPVHVINIMVQALLQAPDYTAFNNSPAGMILYYLWNVATVVILLNVLISLFSSAYSDIVEDAEAEFLAYFAGKTIGMIRAPDSFVYPAPFNLIEVFFVGPLEPIMEPKSYTKLNRLVMRTVFFIPLSLVALFESTSAKPVNAWMSNLVNGAMIEDDEDNPAVRDPEIDEDGLKISKVPFEELIKVFPNTHESAEATVLKRIDDVKDQLAQLMKMIEEKR